MPSVVTPGNYKHYKGQTYRVVLSARHSETGEWMVIYFKYPCVPLRDEHGLPKSTFVSAEWWACPAELFSEEVVWPDGVTRPRFVRIEEEPYAELT